MIVRLRSGVALVIALTAVLPCATGWTANPAVLELARRKIPATSGTTTADIVRMRENLFRRLTLEAYQAVGHRDPAWDADAVKLIEDYLGFLTGAPDGETSTRLIERSGKLLQSGCDDALIKLIHADMLRCENLEGAEPALIAAQQSLGSASYPHALSRFAAHSLASIYWRNSYHRRTELNAALDAFVLETGACLKAGEYREGEERVLLAILLNDWSGVLLERHQEVARAISEALGAESWLARVIDGECQIDLAWKSRTSGWAHQVSEEGWMGFSEHLDKAAASLTAAWKMKPEYPEAAVAMITVSTGQSKPDEARLWLDRAIEAQIDYLPAYDKYFWSLHPRWGGSHRAMYDFGLACLASGRFDTDVPYQFYYALESISEDLESRQALINKPETYEHLKRMFNGYLAARAGSSLAFFKTLYAAEAWKRGDYEAAARRFRELGSAAQPQTVASHYGSSLQRVRGEAYVRTGDTGEDVQRMITAAQEDRHEEALALCTGLLARVAQASDEAFYLQTWQGDLARREALASGKFVPLQPDSSFKGWKVLHGDWRVTEDGWVQGQTTRERGLLLVLDQTLDTDFECQVVVSFVKSPYKFGFNAGLMVGFADENPEEFLSFLIYRAEKKATLSSRFSTNESFAVTALVQELESTIEMRVEKGRVYTWVNGKAAHAGLPVVSWAGVPGRRIGLGSYVWIPDVTVRFRDFRLRLLEDESAPAAE